MAEIEYLEPRRLLHAGELDPTFGTGGTVRLPVSAGTDIGPFKPGPDGSTLVILRTFAPTATQVRRLFGDSFDAAFGDGGALTLPENANGLFDMAVDPHDGRIAVLFLDGELYVFSADGKVQTSFSGNGALPLKSVLNLSQTSFAGAVRFCDDGSLNVVLSADSDMDPS